MKFSAKINGSRSRYVFYTSLCYLQNSLFKGENAIEIAWTMDKNEGANLSFFTKRAGDRYHCRRYFDNPLLGS